MGLDLLISALQPTADPFELGFELVGIGAMDALALTAAIPEPAPRANAIEAAEKGALDLAPGTSGGDFSWGLCGEKGAYAHRKRISENGNPN